MLPHPETKDSPELVAYVVGVVDPDELLRFVGGVLPEYLVPGFVVVLDVLPRLVNGKVDRGGLPVPGLGRRLVGSVFVGPRSEVEEDVARFGVRCWGWMLWVCLMISLSWGGIRWWRRGLLPGCVIGWA